MSESDKKKKSKAGARKATAKSRSKSAGAAKSGQAKPVEKEPEARAKYRNVLTMSEGSFPFKPGEGNLGKHRAKSKRVNEQLGKYSLTEKQSKVLQFVKEHIEAVGFPPTVRQVAEYFGISAKASHDHLRAIAKKGYLRLFPGSARGMELVTTDDEQPSEADSHNTLQNLIKETTLVPLVGTIAAGTPILAEENIEDRLAFPKSFMPAAGDMFALRVKGDSMENAGIFDGDIAVLKKVHDANSELRNGDIVAAVIDGDATLKTYKKLKTRIELIPENDRYEKILISARDNIMIAGKLTGVYRSY